MNILTRLKKRLSGAFEDVAGEEKTVIKPIYIESEKFYEYSEEKKYEDLLFYMKKYPKVEALIFEYFYIHLKAIVDYESRENEID